MTPQFCGRLECEMREQQIMENPTGAGSVSKHPHANKGESQKEVSPTGPPLPVSSWAPVGGGEMMRPFFGGRGHVERCELGD